MQEAESAVEPQDRPLRLSMLNPQPACQSSSSVGAPDASAARRNSVHGGPPTSRLQTSCRESRFPVDGMKRKINHKARPVELGEYIVADPRICHGRPTFKRTRVMVFQ